MTVAGVPKRVADGGGVGVAVAVRAYRRRLGGDGRKKQGAAAACHDRAGRGTQRRAGADRPGVAAGRRHAGVPGPVDARPEPAARRDLRSERVRHVHGPRNRRAEPAGEAHAAGRCHRRRRVELGQPGQRDSPGQLAQLGVERRARAAREADVPVTRNRPQQHRNARREAGIAAGRHAQQRQRVDVCDVEAPGEQPDERAARGSGRGRRVVVAEERHAHRTGVEPLGVRADHVALDAAETALEDLAVLVDEEVVAHVVPAVAPHVVELDRADDRRRLRLRVRVRTRRVVDDRESQRARVARRPAPDRLARAPGEARHDRGSRGRRERARRRGVGRTPDVVRTQPRHPTAKAVLKPVRRAGPVRVAELPRGTASTLRGLSVGSVLGLRSRIAPGAPAPLQAARAKADPPGPLPVQSDEVEALGRPCSRERATALDGELARDERRLPRMRRRRHEQEGEQGKLQRPHSPEAH